MRQHERRVVYMYLFAVNFDDGEYLYLVLMFDLYLTAVNAPTGGYLLPPNAKHTPKSQLIEGHIGCRLWHWVQVFKNT